MKHGPSTAAALAEELDLTPAAVRRHLDQLLAEGVVESRDQRVRGQRGRGRPAKVFLITDAGRGHFGHTYDALAAEALQFLRATGGEQAVREFAQRRLADLEGKCAEAARDATDPVAAVAQTLTSDGYAASVDIATTGDQICQHHCPVSHVAHEFPELCDAETAMLGRVLGTHVQRLATIAHGDGVCTTHVPNPTPKKVTS